MGMLLVLSVCICAAGNTGICAAGNTGRASHQMTKRALVPACFLSICMEFNAVVPYACMPEFSDRPSLVNIAIYIFLVYTRNNKNSVGPSSVIKCSLMLVKQIYYIAGL